MDAGCIWAAPIIGDRGRTLRSWLRGQPLGVRRPQQFAMQPPSTTDFMSWNLVLASPVSDIRPYKCLAYDLAVANSERQAEAPRYSGSTQPNLVL